MMKFKNQINWIYKGLHCQITEAESGWFYQAEDLAIVTNQPYLVIWGGVPNKIEKAEIEEKIDRWFKDHNVTPRSTCSYYLDSTEKGCCFFSESGCCNEDCFFNKDNPTIDNLNCEIADLENTIDKLRTKVFNLENTLEDYGECLEEYGECLE